MQSDRHLWAQTYDRDLRDILFVQQEVVRAIVLSTSRALRSTDSPGPSQIDPSAYKAHLKANYLLSIRAPKALLKSMDWFRAAIADAPSWAAPYAGLAEAYRRLDFFEHIPSKDAAAQASSYAAHALALDSTEAQAHATMGRYFSDARMELDGRRGPVEGRFGIQPAVRASRALVRHGNFWRKAGTTKLYSISIMRSPLSRPRSSSAANARRSCCSPSERMSPCAKAKTCWRGNSEFTLGQIVYGAALLAAGRYAEALNAFKQAYASTALPLALTGMIHAYSALGTLG